MILCLINSMLFRKWVHTMNTTFGTEFRSARAKHDKSQGDISALGVERSYITKDESGAIGTPSREGALSM